MNKIIFLLFIISCFANLQAQNDIILNFAAGGVATEYDSVIVQNLGRNTQVTVYNGESLRLVYDPTGYKQMRDANKGICIYPNPLTNYSTLEFETQKPCFTNIEVYDIAGRKVLQRTHYLSKGIQKYRVGGFAKGIYTIKVNSETGNYSTRLISNAEKGGYASVDFMECIPAKETSHTMKNANDMPFLGYMGGDGFLLWAYADYYSVIITITPEGDTIITIPFEPCFDYQGNGYPIVTIGTQKWMAANLRTQFFNNGAGIPTTNPPTRDISGDYKPKFSWQYGDNGGSDFSLMHGRLYTWEVVNDSNGICPLGWHVPTLNDWHILLLYLQKNGYSFDGTIDTSSVYLGWTNKTANAMTPYWTWKQYSKAEPGAPGANCCYNYRNKSGFSAFASGYRSDVGGFGAMDEKTYWWTSSKYSTTSYAYAVHIWNRYENVDIIHGWPKHGYSVRCVKDSL